MSEQKKGSVAGKTVSDFPEIVAEWHPTKNNGHRPEEIAAGSSYVAWWLCARGHEWPLRVSTRTTSTKGAACNRCGMLDVRFPLIAAELDPDSNDVTAGEIKPNEQAGSRNWRCHLCGKRWSARTAVRVARGDKPGCETCKRRVGVAKTMLADSHPEIAAQLISDENGNPVDPRRIATNSSLKCLWLCPGAASHPGSRWCSTVQNRIAHPKLSCSLCDGWARPAMAIDAIKQFLKRLIDDRLITALSPAQMFSIIRSAKVLESRHGKKVADLIEKAVRDGDPSPIEEAIEKLDGASDEGEVVKESGSYDREIIEGDGAITGEAPDLPVERRRQPPRVTVPRLLKGLDSEVLGLDAQTTEYLIRSSISMLWSAAFDNEAETLAAVRKCASKRAKVKKEVQLARSEQVRKSFLTEYEAVKALKLPADYRSPIIPNLMQRLVAYRLIREKRLGNWSGTGAGKTNSALLAAGLLAKPSQSPLTVIVCPNATIERWAREIAETYPKSEIAIKDFGHTWSKRGVRRFLVLNHEHLQRVETDADVPIASIEISDMLRKERVDFVVIDEVQAVKQRYADEASIRKEMMNKLVREAGSANPDLCVLGMSATPVINNLQEAKSLIEMVLGHDCPEIPTRDSLMSAHTVHQRLATLGVRSMPNYALSEAVKRIDLDCSDVVEQLCEVGRSESKVEQLLIGHRTAAVLKLVKRGQKTLIFSHMKTGVVGHLISALRAKKLKVIEYTGDEKGDLDAFINGDVDVVVGTSPIGTGLDGLQKVCNRLIFLSLPWTSSEYDQVRGRLYRQGQRKSNVEIFILACYATIDGQKWEWDGLKLRRIQYKRDLAAAAVDGVLPDKQLATPAKATKAALALLKSLSAATV